MKTTPDRAACRARAFTLMEMLVVVTIIALLSTLAASQVIKALDRANQTKTLAAAVELKNGIGSYVLDYHRFPLDELSGGDSDSPEVLTDGSNRLVDALLGVPMNMGEGSGQDLNPKRIQYAEFSPAKNGRHGIVGSAIPRSFHDMWGRPFHILLDTNGDNQVPNPDPRNADPRIAQNQADYLTLKVAVYSGGKDQTPLTTDDIATWRSQ